MTTKWGSRAVVANRGAVLNVFTLTPGYEFRDCDGELFDWEAAEVWFWLREGYLTSVEHGRRPVFLHEVDNPIPCWLYGWTTVQHPSEYDFWLRLVSCFDRDFRVSYSLRGASVFDLASGYEFRDLTGELVDWEAAGVWLLPDQGFLISTKHGNQPVFLHEVDNPFPGWLHGWTTVQHPDECLYWVHLNKRLSVFGRDFHRNLLTLSRKV